MTPLGTARARTIRVLATDLDGTFAGRDRAARARLFAALRDIDGFRLLYVTGRSVPSTLRLMEAYDLPEPDHLIADVGSTVVRGSDLEPVRAMTGWIARRWPGAEPVRGRLAGVDGLTEQRLEASPRRVSYVVEPGALPSLLPRVEERLRDLDVEVVGSADVYVDVLPGGVHKGTTLLAVLDHLGYSRESTVVAGDSLNDLGLFRTGLRGIVVGNAEPGLRAALETVETVYHSRARESAGVLDGLRHFGWTEASHDG